MTFILLSLLALFVQTSALAASDDLQLPNCPASEVLETPVTFFLSREVADEYSPYVREGMIRSWIAQSNNILQHSCVPMKRRLASIEIVNELALQTFEDVTVVHRMLEYYYPEMIQSLEAQPNHYYGVVFSSKRSQDYLPDHCGKTNVSVYPQFFILDMSCDKNTLEHELGHLAWAQHDIQTLSAQTGMYFKAYHEYFPTSQQHLLKPYGFGHHCAGKGTLMAYAEQTLPVYSSPDVFYQGIACGHEKFANNALRLREYAQALKVQLNQAQPSRAAQAN